MASSTKALTEISWRPFRSRGLTAKRFPAGTKQEICFEGLVTGLAGVNFSTDDHSTRPDRVLTPSHHTTLGAHGAPFPCAHVAWTKRQEPRPVQPTQPPLLQAG